MNFPQPTRHRRAKAPVPAGPIGGIADPRFRYVPSLYTDVRKTLRRVAKQIAEGTGLHPGAGA